MFLWKSSTNTVVTKIAIAGDFLPSGDLKMPDGCGWRDMADLVASHFEDVAIGIANLECPLGAANLSPKPKPGLGAHFTGPVPALDYLSALKVGVVGLANNHICDYSEKGAARTMFAIAEKNMAAIGIGRTLAESPHTAVWKGPDGARVGFWAAAQGLSELASKTPGVEPATLDRGAKAVEELTERGAQVKVALLHLGLERTNLPDPDDVSLMRSLCRSGFDVVAAAHSHRVSGWERVDRGGRSNGFCFYGLGSLSSSILYSPLEREGLVAVIGLDDRGGIGSVEARPVHLTEAGWGTAPTGQEAEKIERRFMEVSQAIHCGSFRNRFYEEISRGFFRRQFKDFKAAIRIGGLNGAIQKIGRLRKRHIKRIIQSALN